MTTEAVPNLHRTTSLLDRAALACSNPVGKGKPLPSKQINPMRAPTGQKGSISSSNNDTISARGTTAVYTRKRHCSGLSASVPRPH